MDLGCSSKTNTVSAVYLYLLLPLDRGQCNTHPSVGQPKSYSIDGSQETLTVKEGLRGQGLTVDQQGGKPLNQ